LRKKYAMRMTPVQDLKIWQYEVKTMEANIKFSNDQFGNINKSLNEINGNTRKLLAAFKALKSSIDDKVDEYRQKRINALKHEIHNKNK
jgi:hypothetical protein